ncbi:MAG: long-chain-fatty-acid--CoA ligase [Pseudomonadota bacterium]|nr:long-chain-fatty-acid--CoA ligase [Pseudomonadota bacterium]
MLGQMMQHPLTTTDLLRHAARNHGDVEIVSRTTEGPLHRYSYFDAWHRTQQLAHALTQLGIGQGDRVATLAWNNHRHFELYFSISGIGAITHTINPRLFPEQIRYILRHANDRLVFADLSFIPLLEALGDGALDAVEDIVVMTDRGHMPKTTLPRVHCYEDLIHRQRNQFAFPLLPDDSAASLCYTSGTTGNPKGVLYSHRSTVLHALAASQRQALDISNDTVVLPVVPMFHVCAWGTPYAAAMSGAKLVLPGPRLDGPSLTELANLERVTLMLGVPTVWQGLLDHLRDTESNLETVEKVVVGGSAASYAMIREFDEQHDIFLLHAWGMTETSPLGTTNPLTPKMRDMDKEARYQLQLKQGKPVFGVEIKIVDDDGATLPQNGTDFGRLLVRGPWIASSYFETEERSAFVDGWFDTGDVATIDADGYMQIVDRAKDVIKSGGEWISSIELENLAQGHPSVKEACVVGVRHPKWEERPLLLLVLHPGAALAETELLEFLADKVAKWWLPDRVLVVDELPHTATGKLLKTELRERYQDVLTQ